MALFSIKCIHYLINVPQSWFLISAYEAPSERWPYINMQFNSNYLVVQDDMLNMYMNTYICSISAEQVIKNGWMRLGVLNAILE